MHEETAPLWVRPGGHDSGEEIGVRRADVHGHIGSRAGPHHEHAIVVYREVADRVAQCRSDEVVVGTIPSPTIDLGAEHRCPIRGNHDVAVLVGLVREAGDEAFGVEARLSQCNQHWISPTVVVLRRQLDEVIEAGGVLPIGCRAPLVDAIGNAVPLHQRAGAIAQVLRFGRGEK